MTIRLTELIFDHGKLPADYRPPVLAGAAQALHLRKNQDFEIQWPEYQCPNSMPHNPSFAAYPICESAGKAVYILAGFEEISPAGQVYEVKAEGGGVMGPLSPQEVDFSGGRGSLQAVFPLTQRAFEKIGCHSITWSWFYRRRGESSWHAFDLTETQLLLTWAPPASPWSGLPFHRLNPWIDLLKVCCRLAEGATSATEALSILTRAINSRFDLKYDIVAGAPHFTTTVDIEGTPRSEFDLQDWTEFVLNQQICRDIHFLPGTAEEHDHFHIVGCQDTAAALALMASILGIDATIHLHEHFGYLKYILPIGRGKSNSPYPYLYPHQPTPADRGDDEERTKFQFHYYVCSNGKLFDACMRAWSMDPAKLGWLIDLSQNEYEEQVIDRSSPRTSQAHSIQDAHGTLSPSQPVRTSLSILGS